MCLQIKDYDSGYRTPRTIDEKVIGIGGFLTHLAFQIPIYTVSEKTMDELAPPEKVLNRSCLAEMLEGYRDVYYKEEEEEYRRILIAFSESDALERCRKDIFYPVGAFITRVPPHYNDRISVPAIIISPDRVRRWADSKGKTEAFVNLMSLVVLHELAHAYAYNRKNSRSGLGYAAKVIEESLAEATAYSRFSEKDRETGLSELLLDPSRPPEYTSYVYWAEVFTVVDPLHVLLLWKRGIVPAVYFYGFLLPPSYLLDYYELLLRESIHTRFIFRGRDLANMLAAEILLHS
ncbi:MAG: hypothetical protein ACP5GH_07225 [Nitrososphaeria archaeon]